MRPTSAVAWLPVIAFLVVLLAVRSDVPVIGAYGFVLVGVLLTLVLSLDRGLLRERLRRDQRGEDSGRLVLIRLLVLAHLIAGLLDVFVFHASHLPRQVQIAGLAAFACAMLWTLWAMHSNPFFVPVIRVQPERGHRVMSGGPYAALRHPGYAGMAVMLPGSALAMGSLWALVPALAGMILFILRAEHEDRFLMNELEGYRDYARRVKFRLLPGVW